MHVMIATDGTEVASTAAQVAVELYGPEVDYTIVSIGTIAPIDSITPLGVQPALIQLTEHLGDEKTSSDPLSGPRARAEDVADQLDLANVEVITEIGPPGPELCRLAQDRAVDVMVLGAHDRGFLSRLIEPSVARYAIEHAPCHVLVVRDPGSTS